MGHSHHHCRCYHCLCHHHQHHQQQQHENPLAIYTLGSVAHTRTLSSYRCTSFVCLFCTFHKLSPNRETVSSEWATYSIYGKCNYSPGFCTLPPLVNVFSAVYVPVHWPLHYNITVFYKVCVLSTYVYVCIIFEASRHFKTNTTKQTHVYNTVLYYTILCAQ